MATIKSVCSIKPVHRQISQCLVQYRASTAVSGPEKKASPRFETYCDEWLRLSRSRIKESTSVKYGTIIERHIKPALGSLDPRNISPKLTGEFTNELLYGKGLAPKTVKDIMVVLASVLKYGRKQYPGLFPAVEVEYPRCAKREMRVLSRSEQERLSQYLLTDTDPCKFGILLAMMTGIRIGELCALRWDSINIVEGSMRVSATMQRLSSTDGGGAKTRVFTGPPKSDAAVRLIPLSDRAAELCACFCPGDPSAYVLTGTRHYMEPRALQYRLKKYTEACGLEGVHFHTLRHTFATRCLEAGFDIKSLSEILGHASTTVTLERYVHASMEQKRANMSKLSPLGL